MKTNIVVVDDFYPDPERVRNLALGLPFEQPDASRNYPGRVSLSPLLTPAIEPVVSALLGVPVLGVAETSHGRVRLTTAEEAKGGRYGVHFDTTHWSGILYLSPQGIGGTAFYRHRDTRLEGWSELDRDAADAAVQRDSHAASAWEMTALVGFRFNRLALFRSSLFHTAAPAGFGATHEDARLVQLFFFREVIAK